MCVNAKFYFSVYTKKANKDVAAVADPGLPFRDGANPYPFPSFPLLFPSPFPLLSSSSPSPQIQIGSLGKRCKLPQRGLGRSPGRPQMQF